MRDPVLFPQPQHVERHAGELILAGPDRPATLFCNDASPHGRHALDVLAAAIRKAGGRAKRSRSRAGATVCIEVADTASRAESYAIEIADAVQVTAASPRAAVWASQTLRQMLVATPDGVALPHCSVQDAPDTPSRGYFHEAHYTSCAMTLKEWQSFVNLLSELKLNHLMIGLYSCWRREDHYKEFMLMPSRKYRKIKSRIDLPYFSPRAGGDLAQHPLPRMAEEDFLGELIEYASARGVDIVPYFSTLGHNTLIPKLYPETAMRDARGAPKGYGFCTSNPKTYELLLGLLDECVDRYMKPHGLDTIHIGMDEVRDWCECPTCAKQKNVGQENFITRHIVRVAKHLKQRGMRRVLVWHDMLAHMGLLNAEFTRRIKREGIDDVLGICWWSYGDQREAHPELAPLKNRQVRTVKPHLGLTHWVASSSGWNCTQPLALSMPSHVTSPMTHAQNTKREGMEGATSYAVYDPLFTEGIYALGEYAWNVLPHNDYRVFREKFCRRLVGDDWERADDAFEMYHRTLKPWLPLIREMFFRVYKDPRPDQAILRIPGDLAYPERFVGALASLERVASEWRALAKAHAPNRPVLLRYAVDADHAAGQLDLAFGVLEVLRDYRRVCPEPTSPVRVQRFRETHAALADRMASFRGVMAEMERVLPDANVPYQLNRATGFLNAISAFHERMSALSRELDRGDDAILPLLYGDLTTFCGEAVHVRPIETPRPSRKQR